MRRIANRRRDRMDGEAELAAKNGCDPGEDLDIDMWGESALDPKDVRVRDPDHRADLSRTEACAGPRDPELLADAAQERPRPTCPAMCSSFPGRHRWDIATWRSPAGYLAHGLLALETHEFRPTGEPAGDLGQRMFGRRLDPDEFHRAEERLDMSPGTCRPLVPPPDGNRDVPETMAIVSA